MTGYQMTLSTYNPTSWISGVFFPFYSFLAPFIYFIVQDLHTHMSFPISHYITSDILVYLCMTKLLNIYINSYFTFKYQEHKICTRVSRIDICPIYNTVAFTSWQSKEPQPSKNYQKNLSNLFLFNLSQEINEVNRAPQNSKESHSVPLHENKCLS